MAYSDKVIEHYENPRNVGTLDKDDPNVGTGLVGAPACGDVMRLQLKITDEGVIEDAKFKTFGCGSAIASSSLVTEWVKGKTVDQAMTITNKDIAEELSLPPVKIHCSVLAEDAIKAAIADFKKKRRRAGAAAATAEASADERADERAAARQRPVPPRPPASRPARASASATARWSGCKQLLERAADARGGPARRGEGRRLLGPLVRHGVGGEAARARQDLRARRRARLRRPEELPVPDGHRARCTRRR